MFIFDIALLAVIAYVGYSAYQVYVTRGNSVSPLDEYFGEVWNKILRKK
jgi:hypothetical protein